MKKLVCILFVLATLSGSVISQRTDQAPESSAGSAITAMAAEYADAFNKGDAEALGRMFADDVEYTDENGQIVSGRDGVVSRLQQQFVRDPGAKMTIQVDSVRNLTPEVAVERGTTLTTSKGGEQNPSAYVAVHVLKDGQWLIRQMVDSPVPAPAPGTMLSELAWMVGTWEEKDENASVVTNVNWARGGNFLTRNFKVAIGDEVTMEGWQIIGWDAAEKRIRSWTFDSEGGFLEGVWKRSGDTWTIRQTGFTPEGATIAADNLMQRTGEDQCQVQATNRTLNGDLQPNLPTITMNRAKQQ